MFGRITSLRHDCPGAKDTELPIEQPCQPSSTSSTVSVDSMYRPRVGLVFPGPALDPKTWSGITSNLFAALAAHNVDVVHIDASPPKILEQASVNFSALFRMSRMETGRPLDSFRRARWAARVVAAMMRHRTRWAARRLRNSGHLDGLLQIGTAYNLDTDLPVVTYEDMTIAQAVQYAWPGYSSLSDDEIRECLAFQKTSYRRAQACCTMSNWAAQSLIEDYLVPADRVRVVGVGASHVGLPSPPDWTVPHFLFVGMDWKRKNGPAVLRAFMRLKADDGLVSQARLDVVGRHPPIQQPGVFTHGVLRQSDPAEARQLDSTLPQRDHVLVMPSKIEPAGIVYVEAGCCSVPIGAQVGGSADSLARAA